MKSPPHGPGANNSPIRNGLFNTCLGCFFHSLSDRPKRSQKILGLHGAEQGNHLMWFMTNCTFYHSLVVQPKPKQILRFHVINLSNLAELMQHDTITCDFMLYLHAFDFYMTIREGKKS